MGSQPSTQSQLRDLNQMSQLISRRRLWIVFCRWTILLLLVAATVCMLGAATTLFPEGGIIAGTLATVAALLHVTSIYHREWVIIRGLDTILDRVYKARMKPKLREDGPICGLVVLEVSAAVVGFSVTGETFEYWLLIAGLVLLLSAIAFGWKLVRDKTDSHFKEVCRLCDTTLKTLLRTEEDV